MHRARGGRYLSHVYWNSVPTATFTHPPTKMINVPRKSYRMLMDLKPAVSCEFIIVNSTQNVFLIPLSYPGVISEQRLIEIQLIKTMINPSALSQCNAVYFHEN